MGADGRLWGSCFLQAVREAGWAPSTVFLLHVIASRVFDLYALYPSLDIPMHLTGGAAIAFFLSRWYRASAEAGVLGRPSPIVRDIVVFTSTCATAVFWELVEFGCDRLLRTHSQHGLRDTLADMTLGIAGGVAFLLASREIREASPPGRAET